MVYLMSEAEESTLNQTPDYCMINGQWSVRWCVMLTGIRL